MIIFLYGEDVYRAKQKLNEIVGQYKKIHKSGLNLKYLDISAKGEEGSSFSDLKEEASQTSMFKEKKLIIVTNFLSDALFRESFLEKKKEFLNSDDIIVLYNEGKPDKRNALYKFLAKDAKNQEFNLLDGIKLKNWVSKEFENNKAKIGPQALDKMIDYVGNDLWRMSTEIKKLSDFAGGKEIQAKDINSLVKSRIETDIFKTIDAIAQKDKKQALNHLHNHLDEGDSPLYILSMINYQFRNLLIVKDLMEKGIPYNLLPKKSGLHPFVFRKTQAQAGAFTLPELKKIYQKIFQIDFDIKTGKINPEIALDLLIAEI